MNRIEIFIFRILPIFFGLVGITWGLTLLNERFTVFYTFGRYEMSVRFAKEAVGLFGLLLTSIGIYVCGSRRHLGFTLLGLVLCLFAGAFVWWNPMLSRRTFQAPLEYNVLFILPCVIYLFVVRYAVYTRVWTPQLLTSALIPYKLGNFFIVYIFTMYVLDYRFLHRNAPFPIRMTEIVWLLLLVLVFSSVFRLLMRSKEMSMMLRCAIIFPYGYFIVWFMEVYFSTDLWRRSSLAILMPMTLLLIFICVHVTYFMEHVSETSLKKMPSRYRTIITSAGIRMIMIAVAVPLLGLIPLVITRQWGRGIVLVVSVMMIALSLLQYPVCHRLKTWLLTKIVLTSGCWLIILDLLLRVLFPGFYPAAEMNVVAFVSIVLPTIAIVLGTNAFWCFMRHGEALPQSSAA